jgi:hypothetical protein
LLLWLAVPYTQDGVALLGWDGMSKVQTALRVVRSMKHEMIKLVASLAAGLQFDKVSASRVILRPY